MNQLPPDSEARALAALVTGALHAWDHDFTPEEIEAHLQNKSSLSAEDEAALSALRNSLVSGQIAAPDALGESTAECVEEFLVLNRKKPAEGFSQETDDEIQRKRRELIERLRSKKESR